MDEAEWPVYFFAADMVDKDIRKHLEEECICDRIVINTSPHPIYVRRVTDFDLPIIRISVNLHVRRSMGAIEFTIANIWFWPEHIEFRISSSVLGVIPKEYKLEYGYPNFEVIIRDIIMRVLNSGPVESIRNRNG